MICVEYQCEKSSRKAPKHAIDVSHTTEFEVSATGRSKLRWQASIEVVTI